MEVLNAVDASTQPKVFWHVVSVLRSWVAMRAGAVQTYTLETALSVHGATSPQWHRRRALATWAHVTVHFWVLPTLNTAERDCAQFMCAETSIKMRKRRFARWVRHIFQILPAPGARRAGDGRVVEEGIQVGAPARQFWREAPRCPARRRCLSETPSGGRSH